MWYVRRGGDVVEVDPEVADLVCSALAKGCPAVGSPLASHKPAPLVLPMPLPWPPAAALDDLLVALVGITGPDAAIDM